MSTNVTRLGLRQADVSIRAALSLLLYDSPQSSSETSKLKYNKYADQKLKTKQPQSKENI